MSKIQGITYEPPVREEFKMPTLEEMMAMMGGGPGGVGGTEGHGGPARQDTTPRGPPGPPPQHAVSGADLCTMTSSPVDSSGTACGGTVDSRPARLGAPSRGSRSDPQNHGPAGV